MKVEITRNIFRNIQMPNFIKILPLGYELFHADGGTDKRITIPNEANSRFSQLSERVQK
jgi:hypothetical protein